MRTVEEIEKAIGNLPLEDLAALRAWFAAFDAEVWDQQFDQDVAKAVLINWPRRRCATCGRDAAPIDESPGDPKIWRAYQNLPVKVQRLADSSEQLLLHDPRHLSLHLKKVGRLWSVRVGLHYRAVAIEDGSNLAGFWIGSHAEYDQIVGS